MDLPFWMNTELWEVEVDGQRIEHRDKLIVERARLSRLITDWPDLVARSFAEDAFWRLVALTAGELRLAGEADADRLAACESVPAARALAAAAATDRRPDRPAVVRRFLELLEEAGGYASLADGLDGPSAARYTGYIAAYAADRASPDPERRLPVGVSPFGLERERQAAVLAHQLGLDLD
jgi:hypothetical protein